MIHQFHFGVFTQTNCYHCKYLFEILTSIIRTFQVLIIFSLLAQFSEAGNSSSFMVFIVFIAKFTVFRGGGGEDHIKIHNLNHGPYEASMMFNDQLRLFSQLYMRHRLKKNK